MDLRFSRVEAIETNQRSSSLAEIRYRLTEIKYSQEMRRFVIKLRMDAEEKLPTIMRERLYKGLSGRELRKSIYRDLYETINLVSLAEERLEQFYVQDNENRAS